MNENIIKKEIPSEKEAEELFMEELPIVPVYFYTNTYAAKDNVKGIEALPVGAFNLKWGYKAE